MATQKVERLIRACFQFQRLVHYLSGRKHGGTQAAMGVEKFYIQIHGQQEEVGAIGHGLGF